MLASAEFMEYAASNFRDVLHHDKHLAEAHIRLAELAKGYLERAQTRSAVLKAYEGARRH